LSIPIFQVDAFTGEAFRGNPAGVCLLEEPKEESWMQALAETAFLHPEADGYHLRWFTPTVEVALCGHATLASTHVLFEQGLLPPAGEAHFHTLSGLLTARRSGRRIVLDFPATPPEPAELPPRLAGALGLEARFAGRSRFDYLIETGSEAAVREVQPDFAALRSLGVRGVIITARGETAPYDFVSRFFAPGAGIDEDPVTGSAHCALGPYWGRILGKEEMLAYQASRRGGVVHVRLAGDRVLLGGEAVTVLRGAWVAA
jgi:PhzF family phenazine biosynthesis protein